MNSVGKFVLLAALFTAGCVPSLNPLYTEADLITDPKLIGEWVDEEAGETWTFSNCEGHKYSLVHRNSDGRRSEYEARLVKIEEKLFLDIIPVKPGFTQDDFYKERFIATHTFVHVVTRESTAQISFMEPRWLKDHLADNPGAIRHEKIGGEIVLASSPKETQKFLLSHMNTRGAFSQPTQLIRKRGGS